MHKIQISLCLIFCCILSIQASNQRIISGVIYNVKKETLPGVTISLQGYTSISTTTDSTGHYTFILPDDKNYTLKVSCIGYIAQYKELKAGQQNTLDFYLQEDAVCLDMVVVTATRTPKVLKDVPVATRVITQDDIIKSDATHIGDLLQSELPGIEFSFSMNQQISLNMQGFGGNAILFLVDGERFAGETLDNVDFSRFNLANVERIEIVKGAASSLYGSNAVGGVVNIISKTSAKPWSFNFNARIAEHNTQRYGVSLGFNSGRFNSTTSIQRTVAGKIVLQKADTVVNEKGDTDIVNAVNVNANNTWNIKERLQCNVNDKLKLIGRLAYFFREREPGGEDKDRYRGYNGGLKGEYIFSEKSNLELGYTFDQYDKSDYNRTDENDVRDYSNVQHSVRGLFNYTFSDKHTLTLGGDLMRDYLMSYQFANNEANSQYVIDGFVQFDWSPLPWLNFIGGLRYDYFSDASVNHVSSKAAVMIKADYCSLRASYSEGFRAPSLKEMYMDFNMNNMFMIYGNPDLKPESSHNLSLSAEFTKGLYNIMLSGFCNHVENRIKVSWDKKANGQRYINMKKVGISGIDANISTRYSCGILAKISYCYVKDKIKKGEPQITDTRPHTATCQIGYGKDWRNYGFNVILSSRYLAKLKTEIYPDFTSYDKTEKVTYPGYFIGKLTLLQKIKKGVNITLSADNIFNYIPDSFSYNSPVTTGVTLSAGVSIDIEQLFK